MKEKTLAWVVIALMVLFAVVYSAVNEKEKQLTSSQKKELSIKRQFNSWDGSHIYLESIIEEAIYNPKSYNHVKTVYTEYETYIDVCTIFDSRNNYNITTTSKVCARYSIDGNLIKILEEI